MSAVSDDFPVFDMKPVTQEVFSPKEFLDLLPEIKGRIESVTPRTLYAWQARVRRYSRSSIGAPYTNFPSEMRSQENA